jgi:hypothetical protein
VITRAKTMTIDAPITNPTLDCLAARMSLIISPVADSTGGGTSPAGVFSPSAGASVGAGMSSAVTLLADACDETATA